MWTPPRTPRHRNISSDNEDEQKSTNMSNMSMNDSRTMSEKKDQYMVEVMGRLVDALNRSSEVMNSAINTIETLAAPSPNKTSVPDDDSVLINSKRNDKVIVEVKCTFLKINDIDTVNQQFEAEIFVQAKWEEPLLQQSVYASGEQLAVDSCLADLEAYKGGTQLFPTHLELYDQHIAVDDTGRHVYKNSGHILAGTPTNLAGVKSSFINAIISNIRSRFPQKDLVDAFFVLGMRGINMQSYDVAKEFGNSEVEKLAQHFGQEKDTDDIDKLVPWDPKLIVMNIDGAFTLDRKTYDIRFHEPGYKYPLVMQLWRFKGFFKENLELEHFPVDVQDLTISISTERSDKEIDLIEDQTALSSINTKAFMDSQEWNLYKHIETYRDFTTVEYCSSTVHPILHAQCRVARKTGYFVWNIVFIMLLIISLTFAAFTIDNGTADRITVTITLFLTAVAFKLVVKQSLPTISYLTYLDVYVLAALIFLGIQAAQNACMNAFVHFLDKDTMKYYDRWSMVGLAALLVVFHIAFAFYIYRTASKRRRIMEEKDRLYGSKREFLEKYGSLPPRYDASLEVVNDYDSFIPGRKLIQYMTR